MDTCLGVMCGLAAAGHGWGRGGQQRSGGHVWRAPVGGEFLFAFVMSHLASVSAAAVGGMLTDSLGLCFAAETN